MLKSLKRIRKGQTLLEYAVLITIILGVFLAMGNYFKRSLQGRWKSVLDEYGDQYDPRTADTSIRHTLEANTQTEIIAMNTDGGYWTSREDLTNSVERKFGNTEVGAY